MNEVKVKGRRIRPDPNKSIGKGGEADVYDIGKGLALKLFKPPNHPDIANKPEDQKKARDRIAGHQEMLPEFPKGLPGRVITPIDLAYDRSGKMVVGYTMRYLRGLDTLFRYAEQNFRDQGIGNDVVVRIFLDLYRVVSDLHQVDIGYKDDKAEEENLKIAIGDFNYLNVMVGKEKAYLIDTDSINLPPFYARAFTERFVDPLLCNSTLKRPVLSRPYNQNADWYAFAVMLMECLLFVNPYGGVYRPKDKTKRVLDVSRPLHRITVFNPEVRYPKPATPFGILPDDLLQHFHQVFEQDERGKFPIKLLEGLRFAACPQCGTEHARAVCPECNEVSPARVIETTTIRGTVTATRFFRTRGHILYAAVQNNALFWLYHEDGRFKREKGDVVTPGDMDPRIRFRIQGKSTIFGKSSRLVTFSPSAKPEVTSVDNYGSLPVFDANTDHRYWLEGGDLMRDEWISPVRIGKVLRGQTLFWVGSHFGFGFYRAGKLTIAFTFDAESKSFNDSVKLPPFAGQLLDTTCFFTEKHCWFFTSSSEGGRVINRCYLIRPDGVIEATTEAEANDGSWLGSIRGKCAAGNFLLAATDEGIVRCEADRHAINAVREFPDTEPFVDSASQLFAGKHGLYVVNRKEIYILKIN